MEEGEGIGLDPVRRARQQEAEQARLVQLVEQRRRQPARALDLVRSGRHGGADRLGTRDHGLVARKVGRSRNQRVQGQCLSHGGRGCGHIGRDGQFLVDLLDRFAPGLDSEEIIHRPGHQEPAAEINEGCRNLRQRHVGLEIIAGADDQGEADRPDDLADAAKAIGRAHARGPQMRGPDFRRIGPDNGEAAVGEEKRQPPAAARTPTRP